MKKTTQSPLPFLALLALFIPIAEARAYTDPGSGALIWQMFVAAFVGFAFYFRRIVSWFREKMRGREE